MEKRTLNKEEVYGLDKDMFINGFSNKGFIFSSGVKISEFPDKPAYAFEASEKYNFVWLRIPYVLVRVLTVGVLKNGYLTNEPSLNSRITHVTFGGRYLAKRVCSNLSSNYTFVLMVRQYPENRIITEGERWFFDVAPHYPSGVFAIHSSVHKSFMQNSSDIIYGSDESEEEEVSNASKKRKASDNGEGSGAEEEEAAEGSGDDDEEAAGDDDEEAAGEGESESESEADDEDEGSGDDEEAAEGSGAEKGESDSEDEGSGDDEEAADEGDSESEGS